MRNVYQPLADDLKVSDVITQALKRNDLLPPRPDDKVSGELGKRFSESLVRELQKGYYDPVPAHIIPVPKSRLATRPAALLSLSDRVVYEAIVAELRPRITHFLLGDDIVFWPRGALSNKKQWQRFERSILQHNSNYIVRCDIAGFYESIDHERLAKAIVNATALRDLTDALVHFLRRVMGSGRGIPQGLLPSDTLATVYLAELDFAMIRAGYKYGRHGDDIRIAAATYDEGCSAVRFIELELRKCGLLLNSTKTRVLRRTTYENALSLYERMWEEAEEQVVEAMMDTLLEDNEALETVMAEADMTDLGWEFFYRGEVDLEVVIEKLRDQIEPEDTDIIEELFQNIMEGRPTNGTRLEREMFHQQLTAVLVRLTAARSDVAIDCIGELMVSFPENTEILCRYLMALRNASESIATQIDRAMNAYTTEWGLAWMVRVLSTIPEHISTATVDTLKKVVKNPQDRWLLAVEAAKCLAARRELQREALLLIWNTCPSAFRADLVMAAVRMQEIADWAEAFVRSAKGDRVHSVVIQHETQRLEQGESDS